ncbi:hypothetical protein [Dactylosporangium salmoneum]|uniref:Uncharacterized protein n=1 Tax=Dactylosporangium salmoneum TaxID=53361 RepID=A0ABP5TSA5_9ACTN
MADMQKGAVVEQSFTWLHRTRRERRRLRWHGRWDGWRRVPVNLDDRGVAMTPHIEALLRHAYEVFDGELESMRADQARIDTERDRLTRSLPEHYAAVAAAEERYQRFAATRPGQERRLGEDGLDVATIQRRRQAEYERERAMLETALRERRAAQLEAETALRTAAAQFSGRVEAMRQRCAGFGHYTEWRIAAYWRSFLRANRFNRRGGWKPLPQPWHRWALENGVSP